MKITLNGEEYCTTAKSIDELCANLSIDMASVATAKNGLFVPRESRANTLLQDGDMVEILAPLQGG